MNIDGVEFDFSKAKQVTYVLLEMTDEAGKLHRMGYRRMSEAMNELIRLRDGHNWKVVTRPKKVEGLYLDGWLFPYKSCQE